MDVLGAFFCCFWGSRPFNHLISFHTSDCPNCHQHTLQQRRTDQCLHLLFFIPLCPTDTGEPYYQCTNKSCNIQLPKHPIGRPMNASSGPPLALSSGHAISNAPYSNQLPSQPIQPYQQPIGEYNYGVNKANIYPGQHHVGYVYSYQQSINNVNTNTVQRPRVYGGGRVGGDDGGGFGFHEPLDDPVKGTVVQSINESDTPQKGTTVQLNGNNTNIQYGNAVKQPSAPPQSSNNTSKQPSAPP